MSGTVPLKNHEYTPIYSDELLDLITDIYQTLIKPNEKDWVLLRMLDLIQLTEDHFEAYRDQLATGSHLKCLEDYIIGVFLVYLIIPKSIQFQIKNKNYELFLALKGLYDKETGMSNVNLQVIKYIGYIQDKETKNLENKHHTLNHNNTNNNGMSVLTTKVRSYTLPESKLLQDLSTTTTTTHQRPPRTLDPNGSNLTSSSTSTISRASTNSSIVDDLWSPPELQPNDQLKLAEDNDLADELMDLTLTGDESIEYAKSLDDYNLDNYQKLQHAHSFPVNYMANAAKDGFESDGFNSSFTIEEGARRDYFNTKKSSDRSDSYHSIYASDEDESIPTVSSKWLYESLRDSAFSFIIFDIRPQDRFSANHIAFENVINIDPSLVLNSENYQELDDILRASLSSDGFLKFKNIKKYEQVISYTDLQSSASIDSDFISKFTHLLNEKYIKNKYLAGGFDSWTKYLSRNYKHTTEIKFIAKDPFLPPPVMSPPPVPEPHVIYSALHLPDQRSPSPNTIPYDYAKLLPQVSMNQTAAAAAAAAVRRPIPSTLPTVPDSLLVSTTLPYGLANSSKIESGNEHKPPALPSQAAPPIPLHAAPYQRSPQPILYYAQTQPQPYPSGLVQQFHGTFQYNQQFHQQQQLQYYQGLQYSSNNYRTAQPQQIFSRQQPRKEHPLHRQRVNSASIPTIQASTHPFVRLSITGLRNMSNTCYINSMIQCLFSSTLFRDIFIENRYEDYANPNFTKFRISPALSLLFKKMYLNGGCSIVPSGFLKACMALRPDFKIPTQQQDTHEFLMFLLDQLHDELSNSNAVLNDFPSLMYHEDLGKEYNTWSKGLLKQGVSPLSHIFQGQLQDSLQCTKCGFKSSNYSSFYMLSLVIPKTSADGKKLKKITLENCIQLFTHDEILSGENAWTCPKCNSPKESTPDNTKEVTAQGRKHRFGFGSNIFKSVRSRSSSPAPPSSSSKRSKHKSSKPHLLTDDSSFSSRKKSTIKSLNFVVLPPILIIHLSRFLFYDTSQKDDSIVQYPLVLQIPFNNTVVRYKLFGVINHYGTLKSGHYTAITNKNLIHDLDHPNWYYFDDEVVKATNHGYVHNGGNGISSGEDHMSSSDVYVLFYERIY